MSGWSLRWRERPLGPAAIVDGSRIRPDLLGSLAWDELRAIRVGVGRFERRLDEVFEIAPLSGDEELPAIEIEGSPRLLGLGEGMTSGLLRVEGDAGGITGVLGGEVIVTGNAGAEVGLGQRRGLIAIGGRVEGPVGRHMRAGTIVIAQGELEHPGLGMRRGTILSLSGKPRLAPGFACDGLVWPTWLHLLASRLRQVRFAGGSELETLLESGCPFEAWSGDRLSLGRGEVLGPARGLVRK